MFFVTKFTLKGLIKYAKSHHYMKEFISDILDQPQQFNGLITNL